MSCMLYTDAAYYGTFLQLLPSTRHIIFFFNIPANTLSLFIGEHIECSYVPQEYYIRKICNVMCKDHMKYQLVLGIFKMENAMLW